MSDTSPHQKPPVKISYFHKYFGPRGPVPNVLKLTLEDLVRSFAESPLAEHASIGKFQDNTLMMIEPRFERRHFALSQTSLADKDSLWLYELCSSQGFLHHAELWQDPFWGTAWTSLPRFIQERIEKGEMYLMVTSLPEDSNAQSMAAITHSLKASGAPMAFTYVCTSAMIRQSAKEEYKLKTGCELRTIPFFEALTLYEDRTGKRTARKDFRLSDQPPSKKFLMLNRRIDGCPHRVAIFLELLRRDLISDGHISMTWKDLSDPKATFADRIREIHRFTESDARDELIEYGTNYFKNSQGPLPLKLDVDFASNWDRHRVTVDHHSKTVSSYYDDSYFSIIPECHFVGSDLQDYEAPSMISEKTFFAMLNLHPFLMVGEPFALARLREYGYQTFSKWWDESYDEIVDPTLRIQAVANLTKELVARPHSEWNKMTREMAPILLNNLRNMRKRVDDAVDRLALGAQLQMQRRSPTKETVEPKGPTSTAQVISTQVSDSSA